MDVRRRGYFHPESPWEHRTDFTVYTEAGAAFFDGGKPYEVANPRGWTYLYPPLLALLVAPLNLLPMEDQVTVWFLLNLLLCWGCYYEFRRLVEIICAQDLRAAITWQRIGLWLATAAVATALLPTLNCLQRGQVGVAKLYFLLLGLRIVLNRRSIWGWLTGGVVLALPIALKILPVLPVCFLLFLQYCKARHAQMHRGELVSMLKRRWAASGAGVIVGLVLFFLLLPATLIGWNANLRHLGTWSHFMLSKADDGGVEPCSGNSRSARNQSLQNAATRLGNFFAYQFLAGPDDRLVERFDAPRMPMDNAESKQLLWIARLSVGLALLALGVMLSRKEGDHLDLTAGFVLACATMLVVSPVARGHYFLLLSPAVLFVPLWIGREGQVRKALWLSGLPPLLCWTHYLLLPFAGRVGLLGLGTACWLLTAMVLMNRCRGAAEEADLRQFAFGENCPHLQKAA